MDTVLCCGATAIPHTLLQQPRPLSVLLIHAWVPTHMHESEHICILSECTDYYFEEYKYLDALDSDEKKTHSHNIILYNHLTRTNFIRLDGYMSEEKHPIDKTEMGRKRGVLDACKSVLTRRDEPIDCLTHVDTGSRSWERQMTKY
jgi:hypothetical protein